MGTNRETADTLFLASPLHDIGKIGIPDSILLKRGTLTDEEWMIMKRHCRIGAEILSNDAQPRGMLLAWGDEQPLAVPKVDNPVLTMAADIALTHHERWNGSGYPAGLAGTAIPLASRIVAIADVYDALRSERPYKPAYSHIDTLKTIADGVGRHFDPDVYDVFVEVAERFQIIREQFADATPQFVETGWTS